MFLLGPWDPPVKVCYRSPGVVSAPLVLGLLHHLLQDCEIICLLHSETLNPSMHINLCTKHTFLTNVLICNILIHLLVYASVIDMQFYVHLYCTFSINIQYDVINLYNVYDELHENSSWMYVYSAFEHHVYVGNVRFTRINFILFIYYHGCPL